MFHVKQRQVKQMASYTMELRNYIEMWSQYETLSTKDRIEKGRTKLFDFDYPIFDPAYKKVFETHFIRKFYMREIGFETEGLFKFQLETWLIINMPYFNKLFQSELLEYDPLTNTKMNTTHTKTIEKDQNDTKDITQTSNMDGTSNTITDATSGTDTTNNQDANSTITDDNFDRQLESENPDARLALTTNDGQGVIEYAKTIKENNENNKKTSTSHTDGTTSSDTVDHATNDTTTSLDSTGTQKDVLVSDINETEDYVQSVIGKTGKDSYPQLIEEYRQSFLRIENRIFDEMQELFMLVY